MTRRLAAIPATDVVGYSALSADDDGTLDVMRHLRLKLFRPAVAGHHGKVVKSIGDGWLVELVSAVNVLTTASYSSSPDTRDVISLGMLVPDPLLRFGSRSIQRQVTSHLVPFRYLNIIGGVGSADFLNFGTSA